MQKDIAKSFEYQGPEQLKDLRDIIKNYKNCL